MHDPPARLRIRNLNMIRVITNRLSSVYVQLGPNTKTQKQAGKNHVTPYT